MARPIANVLQPDLLNGSHSSADEDPNDHTRHHSSEDFDFSRQSSSSDESCYGIGKVAKKVGVRLKSSPEFPQQFHITVDDKEIIKFEDLAGLVKDKNIKVKVRPMLVSFSGLPETKKSTALKNFLENHVEECPKPYSPITKKSISPVEAKKNLDIAHYELIADGSNPIVNFTLSEAMPESLFTFGVLSAFKNILAKERKVPVLDNAGERHEQFVDGELHRQFLKIHTHFCNESTICKKDDSQTALANFASGLKHSLPDCLTLVNIWDHSISNTVRHLLTALQGHLYNHHMFLFIDLERDLDKLDEPPQIDYNDRAIAKERAMFMKWRPRLHYLLRSAWATEKKEKEKKRACTVFAKIDGEYDSITKEKIDRLEHSIKPVAKRIGVHKLLDLKVEHINVKTDAKRIHRKIEAIAFDIPLEEIPLAWVFLRTWFYESNNIFVKKSDLKRRATECEMSDESFSQFCKFYTSFGSIIDLSLANRDYQYVIINPIEFLKKLDDLLNPPNDTAKGYSSLEFGIISYEFSKKVITEDWDAFLGALESLNLVTKVTTAVLETTDFAISQVNTHYYASLSCRGPLIQDVDPISIHLLTNINTPHVFKQVSFVKHFLEKSKDLGVKIVPCKNINQTVIKTMRTAITLTFYSPAIKIHLSQSDKEACGLVIETFNAIAEHALKNGIRLKYKFVQICTKKHVSNAQLIPSSRYHVLPHEGIECEECSKDYKKNKILDAWNKALEKVPILPACKARGEIDKSELSYVVRKVHFFCIDDHEGIKTFAKHFVPDCITKYPHLSLEKLLEESLFSWYKDIYGKKNGGPEPRRALAEAIYAAGEKICQDHAENETLLAKFEYVAKNIDVFWRNSKQKAPVDLSESSADSNQDIFRKKIEVLSKALATRAHFTPFVDTLVANSLITSAFRDNITSTPNYSDYERASRLVNHVYNNICVPSSPDYFTRICEALLSQDDPTLKDIGKTMMI